MYLKFSSSTDVYVLLYVTLNSSNNCNIEFASKPEYFIRWSVIYSDSVSTGEEKVIVYVNNAPTIQHDTTNILRKMEKYVLFLGVTALLNGTKFTTVLSFC